MPVIPTRFAVDFGEVFPLSAFVLGVEPSMAFSDNPVAPKMQEGDQETHQLDWTVRAPDSNVEAAHSFRAAGIRAPGGARAGKPEPAAEQKSAA